MPKDWEAFGTGAAAFAPDPSDVDDDVEPDEDSGDAEESDLYYASVDEFVRGFLIHGYARHINGHARVWRARYWQYPEALSRLGAIWRAWEHLRLDPATGLSVWYLNHADPHMHVLFDKDGPFSGPGLDDAENTNRPGDPLPYLSEEVTRTS